MFERVTDGARSLVLGANDVTVAVGDNAIGAEHLLWAAFAAEPGNPAVAALLLAGVTKDKVLASDRTATFRPAQVRPRLPFTDEGKSATNQTVVEAQAVGADRVGVEHFVLTRLSVDDTGRRLVRASGADPDGLQGQIHSAIS
jgi:Clp amino terminal domain, pathogenicity island component